MVLGIDPGAGGGIAVVYGALQARAWKMPETDVDLLALLASLRASGVEVAYLEKLGPMAGRREDGGAMRGSIASFHIGGWYRACRMALAANRFRVTEVSPQKWQARLGCRTKGHKAVTRLRAQQLWPRLRITHAVADALLIAQYGLMDQERNPYDGARDAASEAALREEQEAGPPPF